MIGSIQLKPPMVFLLRSTFSAAVTGFLLYFSKSSTWFVSIGSTLWGRVAKVGLLVGIGTIAYLLVSFALNNLPSVRDETAHDNISE